MGNSKGADEVRERNLSVLKLKDKNLEDIVSHSSHVSVYKFDADSKQWKKGNIEGPLFLLRRSTAPIHQILVMNQLDVHDFVLDITPKTRVREKKPYLIFRSPNGVIEGI
eukprot:CAMPEP_0119140922 /NCGR_PEP_ID=MMETSP1310-20130426/30043_1 /TAXON_ID=464262 /ORGANISM="Genus nov. species nov., Strain RCC2339" /LENGTH=109 /DNA_ID=CAMNT_0007132319 /DNA_START=152 /DNA_END=478 /DNA_ORIENTATION=-